VADGLAEVAENGAAEHRGADAAQPVPEAAVTPEDSPFASDSQDASAILAAIVREKNSDAQERLVAETWAGRLVSGDGKVAFSSQIFGRDSELDVTGGTKITVELPVEGAGVLAPKVVLHLETPPDSGIPGFGKPLRFEGEIKGYRGLGRNLLLVKGKIL